MVAQHYRWDFIGLSTDSKPTPATSEKVTDGSTFYCSDNSKLYVWYKDQWYEKVISGGELPIASSDTLGAVKVGDNLSINSETGVLSATDTTYSAFTGTDGETAGTAGLVPAPATTDAGKFLKADGTWDTAGGGSSVTVVQTTGNSTTDVMSQDATTKLVYVDDSLQKIKVGQFSSVLGDCGIALGRYATASNYCAIAIGATAGSSSQAPTASGYGSIVIGHRAKASYDGSVALGARATTTRKGEVYVGTDDAYVYGFDSTHYRVIGGVHDGQQLTDAATVAQGNTLASSAPTTSTVGVLGQLYTDTTNMHTYQCTAISGDTYTWTQRW